LSVLLFLTDCTRYVVVDRLADIVLLSVDKPVPAIADCSYNPSIHDTNVRTTVCETITILTNPGQAHELHLVARNVGDLDQTVPGLLINLDFVDALGTPVASSPGTINPSRIATNANGSEPDDIVVTITQQGVWRVRATYQDASAIAMSYSQPVIVTASPH